jgi:hypothetical protein
MAIASISLTTDAIAQLEESDTTRWQFNSNLSLRLNTGNVQRLIITPEANVAHIDSHKSWGFSARQRYTYGTFGTIRTENDLLSRNFIYHAPERRVYPYLMVWFQTHARQKLRFRYQIGPGVTVVPLKRNLHIIKLSLTGTYERNWYHEAGLEYIKDKTIKSYGVVRATTRIFGSHALAKDFVSFYYEFLFQQAFDNKENWRIFTECGINTKIVNGFSMRSYFNLEYQQVHVYSEKPNDLIFNMGINYKVSTKE